jgi:putative RecB family exonuclease
MPILNSLEEIRNELHISYSQISTYLNCSLRYKFQYVENRPPERMNISLPFGSAIHAAVALYARGLKTHNQIEPVNALWQRFEDCLVLDLENSDVPIIYKRDLPDRKAAIEMGKALLDVFYKGVCLSETEIIGVEFPLAATLFTDSGQPTDFKLFGVIDLLLKDAVGELVVVDYKTSSRAMAQSQADDDSQMSAYAYLLAANRMVPAAGNVKCRFEILRKLKQPRLEIISTLRSPFHRRRFARVANAVLEGIEKRIFIPQPSWMCKDCAYSDACKAW